MDTNSFVLQFANRMCLFLFLRIIMVVVACCCNRPTIRFFAALIRRPQSLCLFRRVISEKTERA